MWVGVVVVVMGARGWRGGQLTPWGMAGRTRGPVVSAARGARHSGGARVTAMGEEVRLYRSGVRRVGRHVRGGWVDLADARADRWEAYVAEGLGRQAADGAGG